MKCVIFFVLVLSFCIINILCIGPTEPVPVIQVWPQPSQFTYGTGPKIYVNPSTFTIAAVPIAPAIIDHAIDRYISLIFIGGNDIISLSDDQIILSNLTIKIEQDIAQYVGIDESYKLEITQGDGSTASGLLTANTPIGALRGLESFSQLIQWSADPSGQTEQNVYCIPVSPIQIADAPRFQWRGVLLDSSRHYLSVATIMRQLDAMSWNKFNVLHWHFVDDESWPVESTKFPAFSQNGAYSPSQVYTPSDVSTLVDYAADRGILILPEFDVPAHCTIWGYGYPETTIKCPTGSAVYCEDLMDPTGPAYPYIDGLLSEFGSQFGTGFVHLGGDEVDSYYAWDSSSSIQSFKQAHNYTTNDQVRNYFQTTVQQLGTNNNLRVIFWEEVFDGGFNLNSNTVINVWFGPNRTAQIVKAGYNVIHSYGWYLDQQHPPGDDHYLFEDTWQNFYTNDPVAPGLSDSEIALILGGEASMWGEQVDDYSIETRVWPRAAATAESLWTITASKNLTSAEPRMDIHSCLLKKRGIRSGPIRPASRWINCLLPANSILGNNPPRITLKSDL